MGKKRLKLITSKLKPTSGFSLVELLVVIALMAIISVPISASLIFGVKVFNNETAVDAVFQDQLSAFTEIKEVLRLKPYQVKAVTTEGRTELQVGIVPETQRVYYLEGSNLMRRIDTTTQVLCTNITQFDLTNRKEDKDQFLTQLKLTLKASIQNRDHTLSSDFSLRRY